jgi:hypothetical protein
MVETEEVEKFTYPAEILPDNERTKEIRAQRE